MRLFHVLCALAACGPGLKPPDARVEARNVLVEASGDVAAIERLLQGETVDGGFWFADPACAKQFSIGGEIHPDRFHAFAQCLAALHWQASAREDALGDSVVLTYAPGFEIEARIGQELRGPRLRWIGYRRDLDDVVPTVVPDVLEGLRTAGELAPHLPREIGDQLELEAAPGAHSAYTWFKVCVDETGAVTSAQERETTSVAASHAFADVVAAWRFNPFVIDGKPHSVCSLMRVIYPRTHLGDKERLPLPPPPSHPGKRAPIVFAPGTKVIEAKRIEGERFIRPNDRVRTTMAQHSISKVVGAFRLCLDETGHVESVLPIKSTGFADYDRALEATIHTWVYSPFTVNGEANPVCTAVTFIYNQDSPSGSPARR